MLPLLERTTPSIAWEYPYATGFGLLIPGFLDSCDDPGQAALGQALHREGITAMAAEVRGFGDLGPTAQLDQIASLIPSAARVVLVGHCYGGLLACLAAARDPRVTDVVALMPTRCFIWSEDYDPDRDTWHRVGERRYSRGDTQICVPYSVVEDALSYDLPATLARLRKRILFVAGERDELIGVEPVRRLFEECGSTDKTLTVLPVQHDFREVDHEIAAVSAAVVAWLAGSRVPVEG